MVGESNRDQLGLSENDDVRIRIMRDPSTLKLYVRVEVVSKKVVSVGKLVSKARIDPDSGRLVDRIFYVACMLAAKQNDEYGDRHDINAVGSAAREAYIELVAEIKARR